MPKMWMVRAGRNAYLAQDFEENNYVGVGWVELSDLSNVNSKKELEKIFNESYKNVKPAKRRMSFGQIARFRFDIKKDDWVVTYNPEFRTYLVGKITSDYIYDKSIGDFKHIHKVKWQGKVDRDSLSVSTKNTIGAIMTLFLLNESAQKEIINLLAGEQPKPEDISFEAESSEMDDIKKDIMEKAFEFIKDMILKLDWDEMQELVAGILRAMGYKTRISSPGPDRGSDIVASPDGLGLEQPRIKAEIKHREGATSSHALRSFLGGL